MTVDLATSQSRDVYKLLIGAIVPRPIAFVSTLSADGVLNLAPFSFFTAISANPPVICFSPMIRGSDGGKKDTLRNIEATGEFVVNVVSEEFAAQMNICSQEFPPEVDEFAASGSPLASEAVKAAARCESHIHGCRLVQVVHVNPKPLGGSIVLGEVLRFHVVDAIVSNFVIAPINFVPSGAGGPLHGQQTASTWSGRSITPLSNL